MPGGGLSVRHKPDDNAYPRLVPDIILGLWARQGVMSVRATCYCVSLFLVISSLATAQAHPHAVSAPTATNWVDYRFDPSHTGFNAFEEVLGPDNVAGLVPSREYLLPAATALTSSAPPVLVDGVIYVAANESLMAIDAATGAVLWRFKAGVSGYGTTSPTVANGIVYVAAYNPGTLYAVNAKTGAQLWTYSYVAGGGAPTVAGGLVYFSNGSEMLALNADTGAVVWQWQQQGYVQIQTSAAVADGAVYFAMREDDPYHGIVALDAATGQLLWNYAAPYLFVDENTVSVNDGLVFFMSILTAYALDAHTGDVAWTSNLGDSANLPLAAANGVVYITGFYTVYALDDRTGDVLWTYTPGGNPAYASTIVANGVLYVSTQSNVYALNASTGDLLWSNADTVDPFGTSPLVVNGVLYVATESRGKIYSYQLPHGPSMPGLRP